MIIGIGGISNSGKSRLAEKIAQHYRGKKVKILCQDDFARPTPQIPKIKGHTDWEVPGSIDFDKFYREIRDASEIHDVVIDEGLFVYYEDRLTRLYDKMIYLSISKATFLERKRQDLRWGREPEWYIEHIWDNHHRYFESVTARQRAFQLSGENPVDYASVFGYLDS